MANIKVGTFNVKGLRDTKKRRKIFQHLHQRQYDIVCLQECHCEKNDELIWKSEWGGTVQYSHGSRDSRGVMILFKKKAPITIVKTVADEVGRWIVSEIGYEGHKITLVNVYAPNKDDPQFFINLFTQIDDFENGETFEKLIMGDFNLVLDIKKDKIGGLASTHDKSLHILNAYMEEELIEDIWRIRNPDGIDKTWKIMRPRPIMERLDFILISSSLGSSVGSTGIASSYLSDHAIPWIVICPDQVPKGRGFWILNTCLLSQDRYVNEIREVINTAKTEKLEDVSKWEWIKFKVREHSIVYASRKNKDRNNRLLLYEKKLEKYNNDLVHKQSDPDTDSSNLLSKEEIIKQIEKIERDRDEIISQKVRSSMFRARRDWLQFGEKPSKYYLNLEASNYKRKNRYSLTDGNGHLICGIKNVLEEQYKFYKNLYAEDIQCHENEFKEFTVDLKIPQVRANDKIWLEQDFTYEELKSAVFSTKKDKVPGSDGLSIEFYQTFFVELGHLMLRICRCASNDGLHTTARQGIVTLIEKSGKNLQKLTDWRPLSLLNCDGKAYMKMIAVRFEKVAAYLIHPDQSGFLKGRSLNDNLLDLMSMMEYTESRKIPSLLISFDFEKAFDKVNWNYLDRTLELFGFGTRIREMVKNTHINTSSCTVNGGFSSKYFEIERGLRQGSPLSPVLFDFAAEILGCAIRQNDQIRGIKIDGKEKKIGQYADDIWAIIRATQESFSGLLNTFDRFAKISGLKINYKKTHILRVGSLASDLNFTLHSEKQMNWEKQQIAILGIIIMTDRKQMLNENYEILLRKMERKLNPWISRSATLIGKITIINTLIMSQSVYKLLSLNSPDMKFIKKVRSLITTFLWNGKKAKIAYKKLTQPIEKGGLKLIDLERKDKSLKINWIKKCQNSENIWVNVANKLLPLSINRMISCNLNEKDIERLLPAQSIFTSILKAWAKLHFLEPKNKEEILSQQIWLNKYVTKEKKPFVYVNMSNSGINYIRDIFNSHDLKFFEYEELKHSYGNIGNYVEYFSLISCIPRKWKEILAIDTNGEESEGEVNLCERISNQKKVSAYAYMMLQDTEMSSSYDHGKIAWQIELKVELDNWEGIRLHSKAISKASKLQIFQYKLLSKSW